MRPFPWHLDLLVGADLVAIQGDPLTDITILRQVKSVMKGGLIVVTPSILQPINPAFLVLPANVARKGWLLQFSRISPGRRGPGKLKETIR